MTFMSHLFRKYYLISDAVTEGSIRIFDKLLNDK